MATKIFIPSTQFKGSQLSKFSDSSSQLYLPGIAMSIYLCDDWSSVLHIVWYLSPRRLFQPNSYPYIVFVNDARDALHCGARAQKSFQVKHVNGGFSSLLKGWLHKAGGPRATKAEECLWFTHPKIGYNSENMPVIANNMAKMKQ